MLGIIQGYYKRVYRFGIGYVYVHSGFGMYYEYWSYWHKDGHIKLKVTKFAPHKLIDSYDWHCELILEVLSLVPLDRYKVIQIK
ncbi:hypothetical protein [Longicatena caecimuris]|uniref:Uncharacterized protein n=1 Tax=Longicatena caecimuris TaxID=1796635 RepID=A0A4R3TPT1_9FIRM|nr:hypothetical protein [Longicatena caecimuris]MCR1868969.1 hypothetical protein [Longicatena caecimuris]MCR1868978.1 hypothetical protein [Longicatena caecimuris]MCU0101459.1 hypothetical protein [Longicatena caecimuris]MCU0101468.1 hypothetical protein [Longicatena caecimuris]TCU63502.1 hypothetical protein EDD61_101154 [Longicatena caecimuris]